VKIWVVKAFGVDFEVAPVIRRIAAIGGAAVPACSGVSKTGIGNFQRSPYVWLIKFAEPNMEPRMVRPPEKELTQRELEVMHVFWRSGELVATAARDKLAVAGLDRAYVTVANLVRLLVEKGFLELTNDERPFRYRAVRTFDEVSGNLVGDMLKRVFGGSREQLLVKVLDSRKKLSSKERELLEQILKEQNE